MAAPVILTAVLNVSRIWSIPTSNPIISSGIPIEVNTKVKVARPENGTDGVLLEASISVKTVVKMAEVPKSIPQYWAANIVATLCMMRVPFLLIVAPKGTVNDETTWETPISSSLCIFNGIVAFEDNVENAKNITDMNFL